MYNKSMGYIIEKMRGDSLTPLGTGKPIGGGESLLDIFTGYDVLSRMVQLKFSNSLNDYLAVKGNRFLVGKWKNNGLGLPVHYKGENFLLEINIIFNYNGVCVYLSVITAVATNRYDLVTYVCKNDAQREFNSGLCLDYIRDKFGVNASLSDIKK